MEISALLNGQPGICWKAYAIIQQPTSNGHGGWGKCPGYEDCQGMVPPCVNCELPWLFLVNSLQLMFPESGKGLDNHGGSSLKVVPGSNR